MNIYRVVGALLTVLGIVISLLGYLIIKSIYLIASGITSLMLGLSFLAISVEYGLNIEPYRVLASQSLINIKLLLESVNLDNSKPIYIPSKYTEGIPLTLVPLSKNPITYKKLPKHIVVRYGVNQEDIGILIATAGTQVVKEEVIESINDASGLEGLLSRILVGKYKLVSSINVVEIENGFKVTLKPFIYKELSVKPLGTIYTQIVGQLIAEAINKPVTVDEDIKKKELILTVKVVSNGL